MITAENLSRNYGDFKAVNDVSFTIQAGEIVGLLGHNGAGKTTIMKMLSGYLEPSNGSIEIDGSDLAKARTKVQQDIGYLPEALPVYQEMSVADYLDYAATLKGLVGDKARSEVKRVVQATDIQKKLLAPINTLSRGYKQRVGVAQAILGQPRLLILDEPTNGLDPYQTHQMRQLIRELSKQATIILSTHIMQEVDALCDRVLIMHGGELAVNARLDELRQSNQVILATDLPVNASQSLLADIEGVVEVVTLMDENIKRYQITFNESTDINQSCNVIAKTLIDHSHAVYELSHQQRDLETVFREVNEKEELANAA